MAKITFERSGGFLEPSIEFTLNLDTVSSHAAQRMLYLIEDADFFNLPGSPASKLVIDEFFYTVTVEAGSNRHSVAVSESAMPDALRPLVDELSSIALFA